MAWRAVAVTVAAWVFALAAIYAVLGVAFALPFVSFGAARIDPRAVGGSWGFRLAILPATVALWPLLARRWLRGSPPPEERSPHRDLARRGEAG